MFNEEIKFIKHLYGKESVSLHEPSFKGNERKYVNECIESTFVSSVGKFVDRFEQAVCDYTGAKFAVATTNGTSALHLSLVAAGVESSDEVITQNITFIATVNAISYCGAVPILIDCDEDNLALSPSLMKLFLQSNAELRGGVCFNKNTNRKIKACIPMHVFGHPAKIDEIVAICREWNLALIEDAAESLGSIFKEKHTGTLGLMGILSFNGNKVVTCGGGGMVLTNDESLARKLKHLSTTAKVHHQWEFLHDEIGYNYRMPNLNAALGLAQIEMLPEFVNNKRITATKYRNFFLEQGIQFLDEAPQCKANFWLNAIVLANRLERDSFLEATNQAKIMTRPLWNLISDHKIYNHSVRTSYRNSEYFRDRLVNIPSGVN